MMKKRMMILLTVILVMSSIGMAFAEVEVSGDDVNKTMNAYSSEMKISYNNTWLTDRVFAINGVSYIPLKEMLQLLGMQTNYNEAQQTIEIRSNWNPENSRGDGELIYTNGTYYKGEFKNGLFDGDGEIVFPDGSRYDGHFVNGVISGEGEYTAANGDSYKGQFANNQYNGYGEYTYANGDTIQATFKGETFTGYACVDIQGEDEEEQFKANEWKLPIESVGMNEKAFDTSKYNGTVDLVYADGSTYEGGMKDGFRNGTGMLKLQNGTEYSGNWVMGSQSGYGVTTYEDGSIYKGYFKSGKYNGYGRLYYANGDMYDGAWNNGLREGYGKYTEANGNYFYGIWQNDLKHTIKEKDDEDYKGYGSYVVNKRNTFDGETDKFKQKWSEGKLLKERNDD